MKQCKNEKGKKTKKWDESTRQGKDNEVENEMKPSDKYWYRWDGLEKWQLNQRQKEASTGISKEDKI